MELVCCLPRGELIVNLPTWLLTWSRSNRALVFFIFRFLLLSLSVCNKRNVFMKWPNLPEKTEKVCIYGKKFGSIGSRSLTGC